MAEQILVRNLADGTKARLKDLAVKHGRSVEAEVRELITAAITTDVVSHPIEDWLDFATRFRAEHGGVDLEKQTYDGYQPKDVFG